MVTRAHRSSRDLYGPHGRHLVYVSVAAGIAAAGAVAFIAGTGWSWPLFAWGLGAGVLGIVCNEIVAKLLRAIISPVTVDDRERIKAKRAKQRLLVLPASAGTGVAVGIVAGASGTPWPDLLLTAFVVVFEMVFPLMLVLRAKRLVALSTRTLQLDGSATRVRGEHDDQ